MVNRLASVKRAIMNISETMATGGLSTTMKSKFCLAQATSSAMRAVPSSSAGLGGMGPLGAKYRFSCCDGNTISPALFWPMR